MSAATSLGLLFSFEKYFEEAAVTFLEAETGVEVYPSASQEELITPRLDIQFVALDAQLPVDAPITGGLTEYRKYNSSFEVAIVTDASVATQTRTFHLELIGAVRAALLRTASNWNATNLPWYGIKFIRQMNTDRQVDGDFQITTITYEIFFSIRSAAFPTTTTTTTAAP